MEAQLKDFQVKIASNPSNITKVEPFLVEVCRELDINNYELFNNMLVVLTEAVNNAILHGNKKDVSKQATITTKLEDNILTYIIEDEGEGFDYNHIPDPTDPDNLEKISGRGVFLMTQLSDLIIFSNDGSRVEIQFKI